MAVLARFSHEGPRTLGLLAGLAALILVTRLPLLASDASYLDGDEALTGVMVQHLLEGRDVGFLTYGASFGVAIVEVLGAAALACVFGLSPIALQGSVLLLFTLGTFFLALAAGRLGSPRATWIAACLIATAPAWLHTSIAAWQYNHAAFLASSLAVYLVSVILTAGGGASRGPWWTLGFASTLAFFTQPIYALALLPFLGLVAARRRDPRGAAILASTFLIGSGVFLAVRGTGELYWAPEVVNPDVSLSFAALPGRLWQASTGTFYLGKWLASGPLTTALALLWVALFVAAAVAALRNASKARSLTPGLCCLASIAIVAGFSLAIAPAHFGYRHLLPAVGFQALLIALEALPWLDRPRLRHGVVAVCASMVLLSVAASWLEVSRISFSGSPVRGEEPERDELAALVEHLEERGIRHVYTWAGMFQWKLMFASETRIQARWVHPRDRYPAFPLAVDRALFLGEPVAIVGEARSPAPLESHLRRSGFPGISVERVAGRYSVIENPPLELVGRYFELNVEPE